MLLDDEAPIASAGVVLPQRVPLPAPFLRDRPCAAVPGSWTGPSRCRPSAGGWSRCAPRTWSTAHGYDPLYVDAFDEADLCLRLRRSEEAASWWSRRAGAIQPLDLPFGLGENEPDNLGLFATAVGRRG